MFEEAWSTRPSCPEAKTRRSSAHGALRLTAMAPPGDLREWIALLEREGELVRVSAEVDPHLEITEITDRVVKAGGPALLFENAEGPQHPLLINQFGTERRMCLAFGADSLDDVGRRLGDVLEMQPPQGLAEKVRGLQKLKSIADSQPKTRPQRRRRRRSCSPATTSTSAACRSRPAGRATPAPFITLPAVITKTRATGAPQRRHVPHAGARPRARRRCTGRSTRTAAPTTCSPTAARGRRRARARSGHRLRGERAAAEARRRADARRLPARRARRARPGEDRRPRGAGQRGDRARGLRRQGRPDARKARSATTPATTRRPSRSRSST